MTCVTAPALSHPDGRDKFPLAPTAQPVDGQVASVYAVVCSSFPPPTALRVLPLPKCVPKVRSLPSSVTGDPHLPALPSLSSLPDPSSVPGIEARSTNAGNAAADRGCLLPLPLQTTYHKRKDTRGRYTSTDTVQSKVLCCVLFHSLFFFFFWGRITLARAALCQRTPPPSQPPTAHRTYGSFSPPSSSGRSCLAPEALLPYHTSSRRLKPASTANVTDDGTDTKSSRTLNPRPTLARSKQGG